MSDLKPCPFCGGPATRNKLDHVIGCVPCAIWVSEDRKDVWQRRTQPEATALAQALSAAILNLQPEVPNLMTPNRAYRDGFIACRTAAAALASSANALSAGGRVDAEPVASINTEEFRKLVTTYMKYADSPDMTSGHYAWSQLVKHIDNKLTQARINVIKETT